MPMTRRDWLATTLGALAVPPLSEDLLALGRALHAHAPGGARRVLGAQQSELVATVAELIIPETDTPGARTAGVPAFIDLALAEWLDDADRQRFLAGLADLDARAGGFVRASPARQAELLTVLDHELAQERQAARAGAPTSFFHMFKRLTLVGYYTSEIGFTQELHAQIIPGRYDGCVPLEPRGA